MRTELVVLRKTIGDKIVVCVKHSEERKIYPRDEVFCETIIPDALESGETYIEDNSTGNTYVAFVSRVIKNDMSQMP